MVEWGEIPPGFETLCCESIKNSVLSRSVLQIYPEVGCACDNLPTTTTQSTHPLNDPPSNTPHSALTGASIFDSKLPPLAQAPNEPVVSANTCFYTNGHKDRLRLSMSLLPKSRKFSGKTISLTHESKTSPTPTSLVEDVTKGGGLDSALMAKLLNSRKHFADSVRPPLLRHLRGTWMRYFPIPTATATGTTPYELIRVGPVVENEDTFSSALRLPGGVVVRTTDTASSFVVETSLIEELPTAVSGKREWRKLVVERSYDDDGKLTKVAHWVDEKREVKKRP
ncbi:hypothetical protein TrCOL_g2441 [Triparma columacea]|uniref:Uncharacterized protein n=1 Tax=Triparma columacea TaxID=722753 RepID=A0A9W7GDH8_9STRA|nr:hypothetical protein TrCOL_g2441 [Triparma columacea]